MDIDDQLVTAIHKKVAESGRSVRGLEQSLGLPERSIRAVLEGHRPSITRADAICRALGLRLTLGADDPPRRVTLAHSSGEHECYGEPGTADALEPVSDERLAVMMAVMVDEWQELDEHGRNNLEIRYWVHFGELMERAKEPRLARVVAWLGWRAATPAAPAPAR